MSTRPKVPPFSTAEQAAEGRAGIPRQEAAIKAICNREGLECVEVVQIVDVSGSDVLRDPQMQRLLSMVANGQIDGVVVDAFDRLCRTTKFADLAILQPFQDRGAKVWAATQTFDFGQQQSLLLPGLHALIAGDELAKIRSRIHGAKEAKRRRGECPNPAHTLPFGLTIDPATRKVRYDEAKIGIVKEIFRLFLIEGVRNFAEIGRRTGLHPVRVQMLLRNRSFLGIREYSTQKGPKILSRNGKTYRLLEPRAPENLIEGIRFGEPIISEEDFKRVQRLLVHSRTNHVERRRKGQRTRIAAGLCRCGVCDDPFYCTSIVSETRGFYSCRRNTIYFKHKTGGCTQRHLRMVDVERAVFDFTLSYLSNPAKLSAIISSAIERMRQTIRPFETGLDVDAELAKFQRQEKRLLDGYAEGVIELEVLRERRASISAQIARLKKTVRPKTSTIDVDGLVRRIVRGVGALSTVTDNFEKKKIVHALFSELRIKDHNIVAFRLSEDLGVSDVEVRLETPFQICEPPEVFPEGMKRCKGCGEVLPLESFSPGKGYCKPCRRDRRRS